VYLAGNNLIPPDCSIVCVPNIPCCINIGSRIEWHFTNPVLVVCGPQFIRINRALNPVLALAIPYMVVGVRVFALQFKSFFLEDGREEWIVLIIDKYDFGAFRRVKHKPLISFVILELWIKCHPDFRSIFADCRD
jgi:hypothetical protein